MAGALTLTTPDHLINGAKQTATCHGELMGHISKLQTNQTTWNQALGGQTGAATDTAIQNAISSAQKLANYLENGILDPLRAAHVKFSEAAQHSADLVGQAAAAADDAGQYTSENTNFSKVSTNF
ncbi:hypothetical protein [Nocardia macrotermitis]|uniref:WXG100 family type VII secretion target n=1 Tax=Nocardia macrotermitis TaxID=2585198 RepID=A0A7K0DDU9_9NOCA|nr:hypothetical protein [Nocardia macrotermitis]MQY23848.1 hypothetical protein [Nocardia macrotermitis]